jgi:hypothetical protein
VMAQYIDMSSQLLTPKELEGFKFWVRSLLLTQFFKIRLFLSLLAQCSKFFYWTLCVELLHLLLLLRSFKINSYQNLCVELLKFIISSEIFKIKILSEPMCWASKFLLSLLAQYSKSKIRRPLLSFIIIISKLIYWNLCVELLNFYY